MGYYENDFYRGQPFVDNINDTDTLNKLYSELLSILDERSFRPEIWEKLTNEHNAQRKAKAILKYWDSFDTPSDDPNIDHKYNRDYLWKKISSPAIHHSNEYDPTNDVDIYYGNNPTGIANPADYIGKVTIEKDTDNDGDFDEKITKE